MTFDPDEVLNIDPILRTVDMSSAVGDGELRIAIFTDGNQFVPEVSSTKLCMRSLGSAVKRFR